MFRQVRPFVTIITAAAGSGLSTCDVDDWLAGREFRAGKVDEDFGPYADR